MSKVDDVVGQIKKDYEAAGWDSVGFQDDQAKHSLDKLAGLNSTEFKEAFDRLRDVKHSDSYEYTLFEQLLKDAGDLKGKPEYKDLVKALESGNPDDYLKVKKGKEDDAAKVEYEDYGFEKFKSEKKHAQYVDLYQPKGASEALKLLIKDTEFTMQWDFDTLGLGNPKAAPDFTQVLDGEQVTSADGWSGVRTAHKDLKEQLEKRQNTYTGDHKDVTSTTYDSKITGSDAFKALVRIMNELNDDLKYEPSGLTRTGNQLTEGSGGPPTSDMQIPVYEKNTDENSGSHDKWFLTAEAEQRYYVRAIDDAVEEWDKVYGDATKKYQQQAENVDNKNAGDHNNNNNNNN
ncbi:hypothetical protein, partial [Nocardia sp. NPDC057455]|uniref:hypothetical protein n=1 Tax=Nocardia sp. NPDC057455 TaxID=3346138 RepID=UPI00366F3F47